MPPDRPPTDRFDADLEARLREESLYAPPPDLAARIVAGLEPTAPSTAGRSAPWRSGLRAAAAVLAAFGAWALATGAVPAPAQAAPLPAIRGVLEDARSLLPPTPVPSLESASAVPPGIAIAGGVLLLGVGLLLARRGLRPALAARPGGAS